MAKIKMMATPAKEVLPMPDGRGDAGQAVLAHSAAIDADKVVAIISMWESAATLVVKPLCVRAKVFLFSLSLLDAVTLSTDHEGYVARTGPSAKLNGRAYGKFVLTRTDWKRVAYLSLRTPWVIREEWISRGGPPTERPWPATWFTVAVRAALTGRQGKG